MGKVLWVRCNGQGVLGKFRNSGIWCRRDALPRA